MFGQGSVTLGRGATYIHVAFKSADTRRPRPLAGTHLCAWDTGSTDFMEPEGDGTGFCYWFVNLARGTRHLLANKLLILLSPL